MHAKPDLRVFLKWMIAGSGSVITDVIPLMTTQEKFKQLLAVLPAEISSLLREPANAGAIQIANSRINDRGFNSDLPEALVDLWMIHDGQSGNEFLFPNFAFLPVARAIEEYSELCAHLQESDPYYDDPDPYAPKQELWEKWYDPILFPIGWRPGSGCRYLIHIQNERIWYFNPDGGLGAGGYASIDDLLEKAIQSYQQISDAG